MISERFTIKHIAIGLQLLALGLTACSADDSSEPLSTPQKPVEKSDGINITIPLSSTRTGDDTSSLMSNMSIVAYDAGGHLIETIYQNGEFKKESGSSNFDKVYEVPGYGTVMQVVLPDDPYSSLTVDDRNEGGHYGIQFVAFYLPDRNTRFGGEQAIFEAPANLSQLNSEIEAQYTLLFPEISDNGIFTPSDENQIPMSGALDITDAVTNYDPALWSVNNPMFLNNDPLVLIRSMAKITIENSGDFLTGAEFKTANHGALLHDLGKVVKDGSDTKVTKATVPTTDESKAEFFNENFDITQTISGNQEKYEFYTFERDFTEIDADADARKLITLKWDGHGEQTFSFKNYNKGSNIKDPVWQGILRNHNYTFKVSKPGNGNIHVDVSVEKWKVEDYEDTY